MKVLLPYLLLPLFIALLYCSQTNLAGGNGSETTNGIVAIRVLNSDGTYAPQAIAALVPYAYNPVKDSVLPAYLYDTADANGLCSLSVPIQGKYNFQVYNNIKNTSGLLKDLWVLKDFPVRDTVVLTAPGAIRIFLPDTVDTVKGYLYFKGTLIKKLLHQKTTPMGGYVSVSMDSVPAVNLPPMIYDVLDQNMIPFLISDTLQLHPLETISFALSTSSKIKPVWRFSLLIAVKDGIVQYHGGLSKVKQLVAQQLSDAALRFNKPEVFDGIIQFSADSLYEYSGKLIDEGPKTYKNFLCRLLYENNLQAETPPQSGKIRRPYYIYLQAKAAAIFQTPHTTILVALLGWTRGCIHFSKCDVDSAKNPVSRQGYQSSTEIKSYMSVPLDLSRADRTWDDYSKGIINYNAGKTGSEITILPKAFPEILGVKVKSGEIPLSDIEIRVYTSKLYSGSIEKDPLLTGNTNSKGIFVFTENPFMPDTASTLVNGNVLISAIQSGDTLFTWFPLFEAGGTYFNQTGTTYLKEIHF